MGCSGENNLFKMAALSIERSVLYSFLTFNKFIRSVLFINCCTKSIHRGDHTLGKPKAAWYPATWYGVQRLTGFICYILADTE